MIRTMLGRLRPACAANGNAAALCNSARLVMDSFISLKDELQCDLSLPVAAAADRRQGREIRVAHQVQRRVELRRVEDVEILAAQLEFFGFRHLESALQRG